MRLPSPTCCGRIHEGGFRVDLHTTFTTSSRLKKNGPNSKKRVGRSRNWPKSITPGVRGIVVGDIARRLVARTVAKQVLKQAEKATTPFQYALSTNAGCECIAHIVQSLTDVDSNTTVVSIAGVGACDLFSRNSMLRGLLRMENGDQIFPFVQCFCGRPSMYLWEGTWRNAANPTRGGRGARWPLFSLGQHPALEAAWSQLRDRSSSHIWTMWFSCAGQIALPRLRLSSEKSAHVDVHQGNTQVWNRGGIAPDGIEELTRVAKLVKPDTVVWRFVFAQREPRNPCSGCTNRNT